MAGSIVFTGGQGRIIATCTADATDGTFPATALSSFAGRLVAFQTNPGATAPQSNYDVTLPDADGLDRLQGVGANRHTTSSEAVPVVFSGTAIHPPVAYGETLTLTLSGNNVNSAVTVVSLYFVP